MLHEQIKKQFPILQSTNRGKPLIYLDSSATSQKPLAVIEAMQRYYAEDNANIHRGVYELSERATHYYEQTRKQIQKFINAQHSHEIIFVRGATEGINLVAQAYGRDRFKANDEIIISAMEHHSNIVPWQLLCKQTGAILKAIPISDTGELDMAAYQRLLTDKTKLVAITHASNVLGTINPVQEITRIAHQHQVPVLVDGAQAFPHMPVDVQALDCDFYVFSAHKAYGPTGLGVLYGRSALLNAMPPYQGGGDMIEQVTLTESTYNQLPFKFEAGTPNIAGVIGFQAALDYLHLIGMENIQQHENQLLTYANHQLAEIPEIKIIGTARNKLGVLSFVVKDIHPHDLATILDHEGIAVRAGHHCAMPLMERFKVPATTRASFGIYNCAQDIDQLVEGIRKAVRMFQ